MTISEFLTYFNGIYVDFDGAYGGQCFDLANGYSRWIGGPRFTGETADLIINQAGTFYTRIDNTPSGFPVKGDIIVWNWPHVAIATGDNTDANAFDCLEQNDPTGSDCHLKHYSYSGVIGWLHPINLPPDNQVLMDQLRADRDTNWNLYQQQLKKNIDQEDIIAAKQKTVDTLTKENLTDKDTINTLTTNKQTAIGQYNDSQAQLTKVAGLLQSCTVQHSIDAGLLANRKDLYKWTWKERFLSLFSKGG